MLSNAKIERITTLVSEFWQGECKKNSLSGLASGKEIGHRIAGKVEESTTGLLSEHFDVTYQLDSKTRCRAPRSMGDVWLRDFGQYSPVNVKAGEWGGAGKPNIVSLTRLIHALADSQIDSYYSLFVKFELSDSTLTPHIHLLNVLDYLKYTSFDAGTGQLMFNEAQFFGGDVPKPMVLPTNKALSQCLSIAEAGHKRLIANRAKRLAELKSAVQGFSPAPQGRLAQEVLNLG